MDNGLLKKRKIRGKWTRDDTELSILSLPTVVWFVLFAYLPMFGLVIAFKDYKIINASKNFVWNLFSSEWVGFDNFQYLFQNNSLTILLRNTFGYNFLFIVLGLFVPTTLAICISYIWSEKLSKIYQTCMFFPHFLSWVVVSYFLYAFLSQDKGLFNSILSAMGQDTIKWYSEPKYWPFIFTFMNLWKVTGYGMVVYMSTITGIDPSLYEAASIDGATKWQQIRHITIPMLRTVAVLMFILNIGKIFNTDIGLFYQLTRTIPGSLYNVASTIDTYVYKALQGNSTIGMTGAVTFAQSVAGCILLLATNAIVRKVDENSALI